MFDVTVIWNQCPHSNRPLQLEHLEELVNFEEPFADELSNDLRIKCILHKKNICYLCTNKNTKRVLTKMWQWHNVVVRFVVQNFTEIRENVGTLLCHIAR